MAYNVGVIGLGKIAAMYGKPEEAAPYCHIGGLRFCPRMRLTGVADLQETVRGAFRERWAAALPPDLACYPSAAAMLSSDSFDVVACCVRGPDHCHVMQQVVAARPRVVFLEKPPSCSLEQMDTMMSAARARGTAVTVSYSRHWAPHILRLQELVRDGLIGRVTKVVGYTGHSFLSFASHTTDLICQFAGYCPTAVYARGFVDTDAPQGYEPEPKLDALVIEFANGVTGVQLDRGEHGSFYADVFGTAGHARVGMYIPPMVRDKDNKSVDVQRLGLPANASVFTVAYNQIADYLDGGPPPHCTNDDFVAVNEIGFAAIESLHTGTRVQLPNRNRSRLIYANG